MILKAVINGNYKILAENKHLTIDIEKLTAENANLQQRMDDFLLPKAFICHDRKTALKLALLTADNKHITIDNQKHVEKIKWQNQRIDNLIADNAALTSTINQQGVLLTEEIEIKFPAVTFNLFKKEDVDA